ncbi:ribokinase [Roseovarius pelagicus]|uniref:Ribokinase n=1 Tax=Roseovarius pelagicus TaxID=2980108 RepID=A0ABY6D7L1_9RHOB|nr:ribokinase [Roseovarius pelagicus]UXX81894.1 ribokinase [Roseovarius pelagicus]
MTVYNLGSINADRFYRVPHLPQPGETLAAAAHFSGLGGKGANQSVAAALAGAEVVHIGAVGADGGWMVDLLNGYGVGTRHIAVKPAPSGHAIITVDDQGENAIVLYPGANRTVEEEQVTKALAEAGRGDWLMMQNETNCQVEAALSARERGAKVAYSAAPFDPEAVRAVTPLIDLLILNEVEAAQLETGAQGMSTLRTIITKGAAGAVFLEQGKAPVEVPAFAVPVVDTTGAGDTFAGYTVAALAQGMDVPQALRQASAAAALMVQRKGTAEAIPTLPEVHRFLGQ